MWLPGSAAKSPYPNNRNIHQGLLMKPWDRQDLTANVWILDLTSLYFFVSVAGQKGSRQSRLRGRDGRLRRSSGRWNKIRVQLLLNLNKSELELVCLCIFQPRWLSVTSHTLRPHAVKTSSVKRSEGVFVSMDRDGNFTTLTRFHFDHATF